jgi:drug/metabolite transporter (DMT)-like permease
LSNFAPVSTSPLGTKLALDGFAIDRNDNGTTAIMCMIAAVACFATSNTIFAALRDKLPVGEMVAIRSFIGLLIVLAMIAAAGARLHSLLNRWVLARALGDGLATLCIVHAVGQAPLADVSGIVLLAPIVLMIAASLSRMQAATLVSLIGAMLISKPFTTGYAEGMLWAAGAMLGMAGRDYACRRIPKSVSLHAATLMSMLAGVVVGASQAPFDHWRMSDLWPLWTLSWTAIFTVGGSYIIAQAYRVGQVSIVAPFRYTDIVFSLLLAWLFLRSTADATSMLGAVLIVAAGAHMFRSQASIPKD